LGWVGLLRHGQSTGNAAREQAESEGLEVIDIKERDADVPLSEPGRQQAAAAGLWIAERKPDLLVTSSYRRAIDTARIALAEAAQRLADTPPMSVDERLRDRELGVLDLLTEHGVAKRYPDELASKRHLGKFYYRPPGGESWADVVLRLRFLLDELGRDAPGRGALLVGHEMTVFALRYLLEGIPEPELLRISAHNEIANGSVTIWDRDGSGRFRLIVANQTDHLRRYNAQPRTDNDAATHLALEQTVSTRSGNV
jgi:broad specificity phosphatase PhoE